VEVELKKYKYVLPLLVAVLIVSSVASISVGSRESIICPKLVNAVTIDGKWTSSDEWSDASEFSFEFLKGPSTAYLKLKHNGDALYVLIDYVSDISTEAGDSGFVGIDTKNDGGSLPQKDDFLAMMRWNDPKSIFSGIVWGKGDVKAEELQDWHGLPKEIRSACTLSGGNDPYSTTPHMIYEFRVQKSMFQSAKIGFMAAAFYSQGSSEEKLGVIPFGDVNIVNNWVELEFSDKTLEEMTKPTPTPTSTPPPTTTTSPTLKPTPTLSPTQITKPRETVTVTKVEGTQIPGGYFTLVGIIVVIVIILAVALTLRKKK